MPHAIRPVDDRQSSDESVVETLVIPFLVIVLDELRHRAPEMPLPDRNQPVNSGER